MSTGKYEMRKYEHFISRQKIYVLLREWQIQGLADFNRKRTSSHLASLFGYKTFSKFLNHINEYENTLDALEGPHAYAIYRMLLIRSKSDETGKQGVSHSGNKSENPD
jgi:hypothetical protein